MLCLIPQQELLCKEVIPSRNSFLGGKKHILGGRAFAIALSCGSLPAAADPDGSNLTFLAGEWQFSLNASPGTQGPEWCFDLVTSQWEAVFTSASPALTKCHFEPVKNPACFDRLMLSSVEGRTR